MVFTIRDCLRINNLSKTDEDIDMYPDFSIIILPTSIVLSIYIIIMYVNCGHNSRARELSGEIFSTKVMTSNLTKSTCYVRL